jgi:hypothetical protein
VPCLLLQVDTTASHLLAAVIHSEPMGLKMQHLLALSTQVS